MIRKLVSVLFAAAVVLGMGIPANAAEETGSISVSLDLGELPAINGALTLYQVGVPVEDGYRITADFGGGIVKEGDATSPHLAQWLAEAAGEAGRTIPLDTDGNAFFSDLEEGLYLIVQTEQTDGFHPIKPFLITLPDENQWNARAQRTPEPIVAENPQTGQPFAPFLGAMGLVGSGVGIYLCVDNKRKK